MKKICKNIRKYTNFFICLVFGIIWFKRNTVIKLGDDEVYKNIFFDVKSFINWAIEFYKIWSGRIIPSALSNIFLRMPDIIFRTTNTMVYVLMIYIIYLIIIKILKLKNDGKRQVLLLTLFILGLFINKEVIENAVIWETGSFNYLWPLTFMMISLIPYINAINDKSNKGIYYIIFFSANLIGCFGEQPAAVLLVYSTIAILYEIIHKKKKFDKILLANWIFIVICSMIGFLAPGNKVRMLASSLARNPDFEMIGFGDKIYNGVVLMLNHLLSSGIEYLLIISIILLLIHIKRKEKTNVVMSIFSIIYTIGIIFIKYNQIKAGVFNPQYFMFQNFSIDCVYNFKIYIPIIISVFYLSTIMWLTLMAFNDMKKRIQITLFYLAGITSIVILGFSPTMPWPGARIFFILDMFLVLIISSLVMNFPQINVD